jgi:hypothetical protein
MLGRLFNLGSPETNGLRSIAAERQRQTRQAGSDSYDWSVPATAPAGISSIEVATHAPASAKYVPLDWIDVVNDDSVNLSILINGKVARRVPAGSARSWFDPGIRQVGVRNDDAAVTSTLTAIIVTVQKLPFDADQKARESV